MIAYAMFGYCAADLLHPSVARSVGLCLLWCGSRLKFALCRKARWRVAGDWVGMSTSMAVQLFTSASIASAPQFVQKLQGNFARSAKRTAQSAHN